MKTSHKILLILTIPALIIITWGYRYYTAEIRGRIDAKEQIESSDHRIYSYEYFYNMYGTIQSYETAIEEQEDLLEYAETVSERQRIRQNLAGIRSQRRRAIEQYNARASMIETRGKFLADDLPYHINP